MIMHGRMSAPNISSLSQVDKFIASIIEALPGDTHYVVMADHGRHDQTQGTELDEDMNIPVLMVGLRIKQGKTSKMGFYPGCCTIHSPYSGDASAQRVGWKNTTKFLNSEKRSQECFPKE